MKIAVINETSAADRNSDILKALEGRGHEVLNAGMTKEWCSTRIDLHPHRFSCGIVVSCQTSRFCCRRLWYRTGISEFSHAISRSDLRSYCHSNGRLVIYPDQRWKLYLSHAQSRLWLGGRCQPADDLRPDLQRSAGQRLSPPSRGITAKITAHIERDFTTYSFCVR